MNPWTDPIEVLERDAFHSHAMRTARKEHHCEQCGKPIRPGERYDHLTAKRDGEIVTARFHDACAKALDVDLGEREAMADLAFVRERGDRETLLPTP